MPRRRGRHEGTISKCSDGRWEGRIDLGWRDGRRVRKSFYGPTRAAVADALNKALREHAQGLPVAVERQTVGTFLLRYLESARDKLRPRSYERFESLARLHINPAIGHIRLDRLLPEHIQTLIDHKTKVGMAPNPSCTSATFSGWCSIAPFAGT
jgi:integrase